MKLTIAALTAVAVFAGTPAFAGAAPVDGARAFEVKHRYVKKKKKYRSYYYRQQYWADKLPVGSQAWWEQMDREDRGGRRR